MTAGSSGHLFWNQAGYYAKVALAWRRIEMNNEVMELSDTLEDVNGGSAKKDSALQKSADETPSAEEEQKEAKQKEVKPEEVKPTEEELMEND